MREIVVSQMYPNLMKKRKFTDEQLIELHGQGLSDYEIAEKFGVTQSTVWHRRQKKLGLPANFLQGYVKPRKRRKTELKRRG